MDESILRYIVKVVLNVDGYGYFWYGLGIFYLLLVLNYMYYELVI